MSVRASTGRSVLVELSTGSPFLEALRRGTSLTLITRSARHDLSLEGGYRAFTEVAECARRGDGGHPDPAATGTTRRSMGCRGGDGPARRDDAHLPSFGPPRSAEVSHPRRKGDSRSRRARALALACRVACRRSHRRSAGPGAWSRGVCCRPGGDGDRPGTPNLSRAGFLRDDDGQISTGRRLPVRRLRGGSLEIRCLLRHRSESSGWVLSLGHGGAREKRRANGEHGYDRHLPSRIIRRARTLEPPCEHGRDRHAV